MDKLRVQWGQHGKTRVSGLGLPHEAALPSSSNCCARFAALLGFLLSRREKMGGGGSFAERRIYLHVFNLTYCSNLSRAIAMRPGSSLYPQSLWPERLRRCLKVCDPPYVPGKDWDTEYWLTLHSWTSLFFCVELVFSLNLSNEFCKGQSNFCALVEDA